MSGPARPPVARKAAPLFRPRARPRHPRLGHQPGRGGHFLYKQGPRRRPGAMAGPRRLFGMLARAGLAADGAQNGPRATRGAERKQRRMGRRERRRRVAARASAQHPGRAGSGSGPHGMRRLRRTTRTSRGAGGGGQGRRWWGKTSKLGGSTARRIVRQRRNLRGPAWPPTHRGPRRRYGRSAACHQGGSTPDGLEIGRRRLACPSPRLPGQGNYVNTAKAKPREITSPIPRRA